VSSPLLWLQRAWEAHPVSAAVLLGGLLRLAAAFGSPGFAFHDDHFEVVEIAQGWLDGGRDWLGQTGSWRSLVYPGLHWLAFRILQGVGIDDPQAKMLVVRLLHAAWSLVGLIYGVRLAQAVGGPRGARWAGPLLACFWLAPFTAVRDLAEVVCQPPLLAGLWLAVREPGSRRPGDLFRAGLWFGLAFTFRFQTAILPVALGVVLLAQRRPGEMLALAGGTAVSAALLQGGSDWLGYGRPFSSVLAYVAFNSDPANIAHFPRGPWHQYLGTLAGLLVPPTSLLLLLGFLRTARTAPRVFWPTLAFLVLHSAYPGKQERFLLPVLPALLVLGSVGAASLPEAWAVLRRHPRVWRGLWGWFWAVNLSLLVLFTVNFPKRALVAPLSFLHGRGDVRALLVDKSQGGPPYVPRFYLGRPVPVILLEPGTTPDQLEAALARGPRPNYVVIEGDQDLELREARLRRLFPRLELLASFEPGLVDRLLRRMNPRFNVNLNARVYRAESRDREPSTPAPRSPGTG
jgi:hypothetical protein